MPPKSTKHWNVLVEDLEPTEALHFDYKHEEDALTGMNPISVKYKTTLTRLTYWIIAHRQTFPLAKWETKDNCKFMQNRAKPDGSITVKFHDNGVVLIQGKNFMRWHDVHFVSLKKIVDDYEAHPERSSYDSNLFGLTASANKNVLTGSMENLLSVPSHPEFPFKPDVRRDRAMSVSSGMMLMQSGEHKRDSVMSPSTDHDDSISVDDDPDISVTSMASDATCVVVNTESKPSNPKSKPAEGKVVDTYKMKFDDLPPDTLDLMQQKYAQLVDDNCRSFETLSAKMSDVKSDMLKALSDYKCEILKSVSEINSDIKKEIDELKSDMIAEVLPINDLLENTRKLNIQNDSLVEQNSKLNIRIDFLTSENVRYKEANFILEREKRVFKKDYDSMANELKIQKSKQSNAFSFPSRFVEPVVTPSGTRLISKTRAGLRPSSPKSPVAAESAPKQPEPNSQQPSSTPVDQDKSPQSANSITTKSSVDTLVHSADSYLSGRSGLEDIPGAPVFDDSDSEVQQAADGNDDDVNGDDANNTDEEEASNPEEDVPNPNDSHDTMNNDTYTIPNQQRSAVEGLRRKAQVVLVRDSTFKYVDNKQFMGALSTFSERASTSQEGAEKIRNWKRNENVEYAICHSGVNDVRANKDSGVIIDNLRSLLLNMCIKFPNAKIGYSEMLYVGRGNRNSRENKAVHRINKEIRDFCTENELCYITHSNLQEESCDLYDDDVHLDNKGGTAVLCSDIFRAIGYRSRRLRDTGRSDQNGSSAGRTGDRTFYNRNFPDVRNSSQRGQNGALNMDMMNQLTQMMCINMLRQQGITVNTK